MSQKKNIHAVARRLEGKRSKELMSSSSLSGMSQLSNSSEETLEAFVHKSQKSDRLEKWVIRDKICSENVEILYRDNVWLPDISEFYRLNYKWFRFRFNPYIDL